MALPRPARLRDGRDIQAVSRHGARARSADLVVSLRTGAGSSPRAAVVVGKRAGNAVQRNRLRRRIQHVLVPVLASVPPGTDLVVRPGPEATSLSPSAMEAALDSGVRRALARASA